MDRELFLNRIALGLGRGRLTSPPARERIGAPDHYRAEPYGATTDLVDKVERFQSELQALGGHVTVVDTTAEAAQALRTLLDRLAPTGIITWDRAEFGCWPIDWLWDDKGAIPAGAAGAQSFEPNQLRDLMLRAGIGITTASIAVANTGTLVLAAAPSRPRSVSLLPLNHIALITAGEIVDRLGQALEQFSAPDVADLPSSINCITGPSRSGDIEGDLSVGVHGPGEVYVIVARAIGPE